MSGASEIREWYRGRAVFITGATGFMGKVLVEKLLRSCPDVGPLYVLVREKKEVLSMDRVEDMVTSYLFDELRAAGVNPRDRIVTVPGDVGLPDLGISAEDRRVLRETVSVVFHVAATVRFDEHMRLAVAMNLEGTRAVLNLCQGMTNLAAVVHVSTAYANCNLSTIEERVYPPPADPDKVTQYVSGLDDDALDFITPRLISGHPNTYTFTKALAEDLVSKWSKSLPIVIVRPSIVSASWKEPQPGWVDNFNGPTALVVGTGKGLLKTMYGRDNISVDLIPVDVCINAFIAAAWEMGSRKSGKLKSDVLVYNCVSSPFKPLTWNGFINFMSPYLVKYAMNDAFMAPEMTMTTSRVKHVLTNFAYQAVPATIADFFIWFSGGQPKFKRYQSKLNQMVAMLEFFTSHEWVFRGNNLQQLNSKLSASDRERFDFDMTKMDWDSYASSYYLGIRRYVIKEKDATIPAAQNRIKKLRIMTAAVKTGLFATVVIWLLKYYVAAKLSSRANAGQF
ncbi:fatty acyl-CoA reductase 1-like [Athalia rosae]|uniref:fatty acyl-CoA reductase 1-like n=1 Tax=Athalia rosae TaxID=37344 RepID=UPI002033DD50|nr:fatty acyl-CoA reductase 1-like [Athalia rosae]